MSEGEPGQLEKILRTKRDRGDHSTHSTLREGIAGTVAAISYGLVVGGLLDWSAGLTLRQMVPARGISAATNLGIGGAYELWRDSIYDFVGADNESSLLRRTLAEVIAFNTLQTSSYGVIIAVSSLIADGQVDWWKVHEGMENAAIASPAIAPTYGWYANRVRGWFGVETPGEKAEVES